MCCTASLYFCCLAGYIVCSLLTNCYAVSGTEQWVCTAAPGRHLGHFRQVIQALKQCQQMEEWDLVPNFREIRRDSSHHPCSPTGNLMANIVFGVYDQRTASAYSYLS